MMRIRLKLTKRMDIIIVYAHTAVKDDKDKDEFYEQLQKIIEDAPKKNTLIISGDLNAKAMRPQSDLETNVIGKHAVYHPDSEKGMNTGTIDNRERLIKRCLEKD